MDTQEIKVSDKTKQVVVLLAKARDLHGELLAISETEAEESMLTDAFMEVENAIFTLLGESSRRTLIATDYKEI